LEIGHTRNVDDTVLVDNLHRATNIAKYKLNSIVVISLVANLIGTATITPTL